MIEKNPIDDKSQQGLNRELMDQIPPEPSDESSDETEQESEQEIEVLHQREQALRAHRDELAQQLSANLRVLEAIEDQELGILRPGHVDEYYSQLSEYDLHNHLGLIFFENDVSLNYFSKQLNSIDFFKNPKRTAQT